MVIKLLENVKAHFTLNQKESEITWLYQKIQNYLPLGNNKEYIGIEIGMENGGTTYFLSSHFDKYISCEIYPKKCVVDKLVSLLGNKFVLCNGSSQDFEKALYVYDTIQRPADFLFIDGDHSYDGVKRDFELWKNLVRPGGFIAFHDIIDGAFARKHKSHCQFYWRELKSKYYTEEYFNPYDETLPEHMRDSMGIGLLKLKNDEYGWFYDYFNPKA